MTSSETPSFVFRNTSLTIRVRFTPARSCSTLTRIRANFRFVRFSPAVSSLPRGFFFRLAGLLNCWLIALESDVLVQDGSRRIGNLFVVGNLLVVGFPWARSAQVVNPLPPSVDDDHVLVAMLLLSPAVVQSLFLGVFRPLATPFRTVDDQLRVRVVSRLTPRKAVRVPFG